eukprot:CAMPEP_0178421964 /NCGR_PEP_ID=MMETSP0689_2-20121128/26924_1 /TAXON_ID=160604 /ORGANISM="Amphidinium massartii, Strain CS-259" /LENGTH=186 /DNA_ID=CAMNT_0020043503 /DNA_START=83 /DNA_END=643 /DNA_ORIENTATION=+
MAAAMRSRSSLSACLVLAATLALGKFGMSFLPSALSNERSTDNALKRREVLREVSMAGLLGATTAMVADEEGAWAVESKWNGRYSDPKHPRCERSIFVSYDGKKVKITGYDPEVGVKCLTGGVQEYRWSLQGTIEGLNSDTMTVEAARRSVTTREEKSGGKWDPVEVKWDGDGIVFSDGTKWTKKG